jgi:hypothetical protein
MIPAAAAAAAAMTGLTAAVYGSVAGTELPLVPVIPVPAIVVPVPYVTPPGAYPEAPFTVAPPRYRARPGAAIRRTAPVAVPPAGRHARQSPPPGINPPPQSPPPPPPPQARHLVPKRNRNGHGPPQHVCSNHTAATHICHLQ